MDSQRARIFGTAAQEYDRVRPGYPAALFDDVLEYARMDGLPALDVGAGTGRASLPLAERGVRVTAVEPDADMAAVLSRRAQDLPVEVVVTRFEGFEPTRPYGLLICAQAWHWVDPAVRWRRGADALTDHGALALCWNGENLSAPLLEHLRAAYRTRIGDVETPDYQAQVDQFAAEFHDQPTFVDHTTQVYRWSRTMPAADFIANLGTNSAFLVLDQPVREAFLADLAGRLDDEVVVDMVTRLFLARRKPRDLGT
jgi:SAM-dependent methyltransferase